MKNNQFFKPTPLYKEYMLLELIEKDHQITQRQMSKELEVSLSMINTYLEEYEKKGYLKRKYLSSKVVEYHISKSGIERKKVLNIGYLKSAQDIYNYAKKDVENFLSRVKAKGFKKILLYGAGEVAEILLHTIKLDSDNGIEVLAIIDDDPNKVGKEVAGTKIISINQIHEYNHDGIMVSSYTNNSQILKSLLKKQYLMDKIILFFE